MHFIGAEGRKSPLRKATGRPVAFLMPIFKVRGLPPYRLYFDQNVVELEDAGVPDVSR